MAAGPQFRLYKDGRGEWRWRLVVSNENIIADSGEGYASKQGAKRDIESVKQNVPRARIVVSEQARYRLNCRIHRTERLYQQNL